MLATPVSDAPRSSRLQRDCRRLARVAPVVCVLLGMLLFLERFGPWIVAWPTARQMGAAFVDLAGPAAFLAGLWRLGAALEKFAERGRLVSATADGLRAVGIALTFGGLFQTFVAPGVKTALGAGPGYFVGLDAAAIVIAAVGAGLMAISRLLRRAASMEAELDDIL
jgi:hypothetical protein